MILKTHPLRQTALEYMRNVQTGTEYLHIKY